MSDDIKIDVDFEGFKREAKWVDERELRNIIGANLRKGAFDITKALEKQMKKSQTEGVKGFFKKPVKSRNKNLRTILNQFWKRDLPNYQVLQTQDEYTFFLAPSNRVDPQLQSDLDSKNTLVIRVSPEQSRAVPGRHLKGPRNAGKGQKFTTNKGVFVRRGKKKSYMVKSFTSKASTSSIKASHWKDKAIAIYKSSNHFQDTVEKKFRRIIEILNKK